MPSCFPGDSCDGAAALTVGQCMFKEAAGLGTAFEALWLVEAVRRMKQVFRGSPAQSVFSMGPCKPGFGIALNPLEHVLNPEPPAVVPAPAVENSHFDFSIDGLALLPTKQTARQAGPDCRGVVWFSIISCDPARKRKVDLAPSLDACAIALVTRDVLDIDVPTQTLEIAVEGADGKALTPQIMGASALSATDVLAVRLWQRSEFMYTLTSTVPQDKAGVVEDTVDRMLKTFLPGQSQVYRSEADCADDQVALAWLESQILVTNIWRSDVASGWKLTPRGYQHLQVKKGHVHSA